MIAIFFFTETTLRRFDSPETSPATKTSEHTVGIVNSVALDLEDARRRYHFSFTREDHDRLPFYSALMIALEGDRVAQELLAGVRVEQRNPMLVLATLHLAALRGHPVLTPIYVDARHGAISDHEAAARDVVRVLQRRAGVGAFGVTPVHANERAGPFGGLSGGHRATSRNAGTGRSISSTWEPRPASICTSISSRCAIAMTAKPLTLVCRDETPLDRSLPLPEVVSRVGIDPSPLDLSLEDDRLWLQACLWPEEPRRVDRLDAIVAASSVVARDHRPSRHCRGATGRRDGPR